MVCVWGAENNCMEFGSNLFRNEFFKDKTEVKSLKLTVVLYKMGNNCFLGQSPCILTKLQCIFQPSIVLKFSPGSLSRLGSNLFQNFESKFNEEEDVEKAHQGSWGLMSF